MIRALAGVAGILAVAGPLPVLAQATGTLAGLARDTTGAVLPGVSVTLTGSVLAVPRTAVTNEHGGYEIDGLPRGRYVVEAALSGFRPEVAEIAVDGLTTHHFVLAVVAFSERMTVTATKTGAADIQSTPISITALSDTVIGQLGIEAAGGLAGFVPSLTVSQTPGGGRVLVTIRGIGTNSGVAGADASSTLYLDGVYLARAAMATMDFLDVERVEVLRGPQGTLYGRNSVGGAIHILTRQPTNTLETHLRFTGGSDHKFRVEGAVRGPLVKNKLMGSFAFLRGSRDGFVTDLDHPDHRLGGEDTWVGRGQLRIVLGRRGELLLSGDYGRFDGIPLPYAKPIKAKPGFSFDTPANPLEVRASDLASAKSVQEGAAAKLTLQLNDTTTLSSLTAYRESNDRFFFDRDSTELSIQTADVPDAQRQISQELTVARHTATLTWIAGAYLFSEHDYGPVEVTLLVPGLQVRPFSTINARSQAVFGQATYHVSNRVSLTGGVRYSAEEKDAHNTGGTYRRGTAVLADPTTFYAFSDSATFPAWTPKLAVQVQPSRNTFAFVSATRGFKSGGFNPTTRAVGRAFRPEFAWSYEGGVKRTLAGGRARVNAAVFYNDYRDLQVQSFIAPGVQDTRNAASATIAGVELEAAGAWGGLQVVGHMSWLDATYDRYIAIGAGNVTGDAAGHRLNNAPEWSGSSSAVYEFPIHGATTAFVRGDVSWQSRVFFTPFNDAVETQPAYALVHLRIGLQPRSRRWELTAYSRNLLNRHYLTGTLNLNDLPAITGRPGEPRQWGTQLTIRR